MSEAMTESSVDRPAFDRPAQLRKARLRSGKNRQRSSITNGSRLLAGIDGRSPWVRRAKDLIGEHLSDLGGPDSTSAAERSIVRRVAVLSVELEHLETRFATAGEANAADLDLYQRTANSLRRLLEAVGLQRRPRDVTPSVADYLEHLNQVAPKPPLESPGKLAGEGLAPGWEAAP
jgi:hypothetical protein